MRRPNIIGINFSGRELEFITYIHELENYIETLAPYCDTCKYEEDGAGCDECNRKSFNWSHKPLFLKENNKP